MLKSKRFLLLLVALVAAVIAALYAFSQLSDLEARLAEEQDFGASQRALLDAYGELIDVDSVFHAMDYRSALAAYADLRGEDSLLRAEGLVAPRIAHAERLIRLQGMLDTLRNRKPRTVLAPATALPDIQTAPVRSSDLEEREPDRYDSLRFALTKAETQVRNLQRRMTRSSGPNYLTFESPEGNETYYVGEIKNGKADGKGVALLSTGSRYLGEWKNNLKHGEGEYHWTDGAWYEGEYENGQRSGNGTYHFPDGGMYVGEWEDDVRNGKGVYYNKKGKVIAEGKWMDDELVEQR